MPTVKHDITVQKGAAFKLNIQARNSDGSIRPLTSYKARFMVRVNIADVSPVMSGTTETGEMTINAPGGVVMINVSSAVTTAMTWETGFWDCEIYTGATDAERIAEGFASLSPEVTR